MDTADFEIVVDLAADGVPTAHFDLAPDMDIVAKLAYVNKRNVVTIRASSPTKFCPERLEVDAEIPARDWVIHDIRIDGKTAYQQAAAIPLDMFAISMIDSFVSYPFGTHVEIDVQFVGLELAASLRCRLVGIPLPTPTVH